MVLAVRLELSSPPAMGLGNRGGRQRYQVQPLARIQKEPVGLLL